MVFSSLIFLFVFLPAVLLLYYGSPGQLKNAVLFAASLVFYAWGEPVYIALMLLSTVTDYAFGRMLERQAAGATAKKRIVAASVAVNLAVLGFFKYADFLIGNVNALLGTSLPPSDLPLPIGISFYTFQSISYVIDIYRGKAKAQRNWLDFATFVALFPQLVAGPIVQYASVAEQLRRRTMNTAKFAEGVRRFTIGLAKKVLLANNIGLVWRDISASGVDTLTVAAAWIGIIAFAFQIYFDFSGYSDMAIGLGLMLGFRFNENFNKPYISQSITEFWRRWHMSLGSWFRDYVYIPLGGNRRGIAIQLRNIMIVWALTGFWHGASWNFLLWGLYFGIILMLEKLFLLRLLRRLPRLFRHLYALLLILGGWVLFAFEQMSHIAAYFSALVGAGGTDLWDRQSVYLLYTNALLLLLLSLAALPWKEWLGGERGIAGVDNHASPTTGANSDRPAADVSPAPRKPFAAFATIVHHPLVGLVWHAALLFMSVAYLVDATYNPFLYFRF